MKENTENKLWTPIFVIVIFTIAACYIGAHSINSSGSVYLEQIGANATYMGYSAAIFSVVAAVVRLVAGTLVDHFGRKLIASLGFCTLVIGATIPFIWISPEIYLAARAIQGAGFSIGTTALNTIAADVVPVARLGEGLGYSGIGQSLGQAVGPAVGLALVMGPNPQSVFIFAIALVGISFVLLCFIRYEKHPQILPLTAGYRIHHEEAHVHKNTSQEDVSSKSSEEKNVPVPFRAIVVMMPILTFSIAVGFNVYYMGYYGTSLGIANAGLWYTITAVTMILIRIFGGKFLDKYPPIIYGATTAGCGLVAFAFLIAAPINLILYFVGAAFYGVFAGILFPFTSSMGVKYAPATCWGRTNAIYLLFCDGGIAVACLLFGFIIEPFGLTTCVYISTIAIVAAFIQIWFTYPDHGTKIVVSYEEQQLHKAQN